MRASSLHTLVLAAVAVSSCHVESAGPALTTEQVARPNDRAAADGNVPNEWQTISVANAFTFRLPSELKQYGGRGVESFYGSYISDSMSFAYDYNGYDPQPLDFSKEFGDIAELTEEVTWISGKRARIVTARLNDPKAMSYRVAYDGQPLRRISVKYLAGVHIADTGRDAGDVNKSKKYELKMTAYCADESEQQAALRVFRSIRFR